MKPLRIAIIGTSGSGKTTLAKKLSGILNCPHIEIDAYAWNSNWVKKNTQEILDSLRERASSPSWISCGNYRITHEIIWKQATHLVWLQLPFITIISRLLKRTLRNIFSKTTLSHGNRETFKMQFFSKKSIFLWAFNTHWKRKKEYKDILNSGAYSHLKIIILKSQKEIDQFVEEFISFPI